LFRKLSFINTPLQHQKILRVNALDIFCVAAAAKLLPLSATGSGSSRNS
jgi:hypothetical protein